MAVVRATKNEATIAVTNFIVDGGKVVCMNWWDWGRDWEVAMIYNVSLMTEVRGMVKSGLSELRWS